MRQNPFSKISVTKAGHATSKHFAWQSGYGIFSVGVSEIDATRKYMENQETHHRNVSFQEELREFLKLHSVEYDERYLWD